MADALTDRAFWENYWRSKTGLDETIPADHTFYQQLGRIVRDEKVKTAIEIGGFPGYYAVYLQKFLGVKTALFDFFIDEEIIAKLLTKNLLSENSVPVIEGDLFRYAPVEKYDLVLSCGLIEHFEDTEGVIREHLKFLKPGGSLFITLPNFRSVNGWVQKRFDRHNFDKHNLASMDPEKLRRIAGKLGLQEVKAGYFGRFSVWLEDKRNKKSGVKTAVRLIWILGKIITRILPVETKMMSPYIVFEARLPLSAPEALA
ncbi:MAG: methyltransferase domain-containing protein [Mucilaginibacter polytrichastri]|nr:methyltransferase domain-containing protein [Mucilaginibacter polytrichastri]